MTSSRYDIIREPGSALLTVIVPVRWTDHRPDILDRLRQLRSDRHIPDDVAFLIVDDGSPAERTAELEATAHVVDAAFLHLDSEHRPFSIGRARNAGAVAARSRYVMFLDADLLAYDGFYRDVVNEIAAQRLGEDARRFLMFGVAYLTETASTEWDAIPCGERRQRYLQALFEADESRVEKFSTGTSVILLDREYYLLRGGNDESFENWGFEDMEFNFRLTALDDTLPEPTEYSLSYRNFRTIHEWRGWRSAYRLNGDLTFMKGLVLFHLHHPVHTDSDYQRGRQTNEAIFNARTEAFLSHGAEPPALVDPSRGRTLLFSKTNPFVHNRGIIPRLGELVFADENELAPDALVELVAREKITRVLFFNPYGSEHRLSLFRRVRDEGISFVIAERGALRDSLFYDPTGFNAESRLYDRERWDQPLTDDARTKVEAYIAEERAVDGTLERQGARCGPSALRSRLGLDPQRPVLFVPLQRPSDTVIRYFCGPIGTYARFLELVRELTRELQSDWHVVFKVHPLEDDTPALPGATNAGDAHIKDLLDLADAVLVINSGVGCIAQLWELPVYVAGNAFYAHDGVTRPAVDAAVVAESLRARWKPDRETMLRFASYLVSEYYSFGRFTTREIPWKDGGRMTVTSGIDLYEVRGFGLPHRVEGRDRDPRVPYESVLFDRYRKDLDMRRREVGYEGFPVSDVRGRANILRRRAKRWLRAPARALTEQAPEPLRGMARRVLGWRTEDGGR